MNNNDILNKYIDLIDKDYCSDCNELNCIGNFPHKKIARAITDLQHQLQKQHSVIEEIKKYIKNIDEEEFVNTEHYVAILDKINELEKEIPKVLVKKNGK